MAYGDIIVTEDDINGYLVMLESEQDLDLDHGDSDSCLISLDFHKIS